MGKFAKAKKAGQISDKSRAARRAASPSLNLDKSITSLNPPVEAKDYNPKSHGAHDSGISKKQNQKRMTRAQRKRHEKGLERADVVIEQLEVKRTKSLEKAKRTKDRAGDWEELNKKYTSGLPTKSSNPFQLMQDGDDDDDDEDDMSDDNAPAALKAANNQTISAQNMSRFDTAPAGPAVPAPDVSTMQDKEVDEEL